MSTLYACPICSQPLTLTERSWHCPENHHFDQHKKGYVNLLTVQRKRSKVPGDHADMVLKRRQFLEAGYYAPLAKALVEACRQRFPENAVLLDAGCGEGYYTQAIAEANSTFHCYGLDISKASIQAASKYKNIKWSVASSAYPPFMDESFEGIMSIFSRVDSESFARILKRGGKVCMVSPGERHLHGLRSLIYEEVLPYDTHKHKSYFDARFTLIDEQDLQFELLLMGNASIQNLLGMTPHAHRLPVSAKEKIAGLSELKDMASFKIYWFERSAAQ